MIIHVNQDVKDQFPHGHRHLCDAHPSDSCRAKRNRVNQYFKELVLAAGEDAFALMGMCGRKTESIFNGRTIHTRTYIKINFPLIPCLTTKLFNHEHT